MFLLLEPEKGKMKLKLKVVAAEFCIEFPTEKAVYKVRLYCCSNDLRCQVDLYYNSMKDMMRMCDGIRAIVPLRIIYGSIAELEAAALSALEGVLP